LAQEDITLTGWAMESRLYAEDPYRNFLPSIGRLTRYRPPAESAADTLVVRNDTGVYEGGEISMFYDPMIAKLCTWAPTRLEAIEGMRDALDAFEVEGIGHNIPFLSAVMDHDRFVSGEITTAFIAEEYPDGFQGVDLPYETLRKLAVGAAALKRRVEDRATQISGAMRNHKREVQPDWVSVLGKDRFAVTITSHNGMDIVEHDGVRFEVATDWQPGATLARATVNGEPIIAKTDITTGGARLRYRGADLKVQVLSPRVAELAALMPEKLPPDTSKMLLCPMPGLVVSVAVEVGQEVQEGQALCTVEAMKMENVLRAEKRAVVTKINAAPGDSLAVDEVIMEFGEA
ncbi:MAG: biotin/lipoyl-containing protein, partial [Pseudomonadota bacterium]